MEKSLKNTHMAHKNANKTLYKNITIMIIASIVISYFAMSLLIYQNRTMNLNKIYSSLLMGVLMGFVELVMFMFMMNRFDPYFLVLSGIFIIFIIILTELIRKQYFITEKEFMKSMIEHHQMGIDMALAIKTKGVQSPELANIVDNIISSQAKEIETMKRLLGSS